MASGLVPAAAVGAGSDDIVQSKGDGGPAVRGDPVGVRASLGAGRPLDSGVRGRMEGAMGTSLGGVRIHEDAGAARVAGDLNSRAVTVGQDIAFGRGQYQPDALEGQALLAHELAHTVQQRDAHRPADTLDGAALEASADHAAVHVVANLLGAKSDATPDLAQRTGLRVSGCPAAPAGMALAGAGAGGATVGAGAATTGTVTLFGITMTTTEALVTAGIVTTGTVLVADKAMEDGTIDVVPPFPVPMPRTRDKEKSKPQKPLWWNAGVSVSKAVSSGGPEGGLDFRPGVSSAIVMAGRSVTPGSSGMAYQWQAHHTWPKQYGGSATQPMMGVRQALHQGVIHPLLWSFLNAAGHDVTTSETSPKNVAFIARLRTDMAFRVQVAAELTAFYSGLNAYTDPPIPAAAYSRGILKSLTDLGGGP